MVLTSVITIVPIAFATMMEHVVATSPPSAAGRQESSRIRGLYRTLIGDGLGTTVAALFGHRKHHLRRKKHRRTGVDRRLHEPVRYQAGSHLRNLAFSPKFAAIIEVMPTATIGGISDPGTAISAIGVRNVVENKTNFQESRNVIVAALILGLAVGINFSGSRHSDRHRQHHHQHDRPAVASIVARALSPLPGKDYHRRGN